MEAPLGLAVGNAAEVVRSLECSGPGPLGREDVSLGSARMLELGSLAARAGTRRGWLSRDCVGRGMENSARHPERQDAIPRWTTIGFFRAPLGA